MRYRKTQAVTFTSICLILVIGFFVDLLRAQASDGAAGAFLRMGVGARPLAMGGAFVGMADGPSATYWNPAGLSQIRNLQLEFMSVNLPFDRTSNFFSGVLPIKGVMTLGIGWIGLRVSEIEGRSANTAEPDYLFGSNENAFFISGGKSISSFLAIGGNVKIIRNQIEEQTASGLGFDVAMLIHASERLKLGIMVQDIGTDYRWNNQVTEGVPINLRIGATYEVYDGVALAADVSRSANAEPRFHFGGEIRVVDTLPIRIGFDNKQISGGAGFMLPFAHHSLELSYAYSNDRVFNDAIHRVSLVFSSARPARRFNASRGRTLAGNEWNDRPANPANPKQNKIVVKAKVLNVRTGPGTKYPKMAKIYRAQEFRALEKRGNWQKIELSDGAEGWVHQSYIKIVN